MTESTVSPNAPPENLVDLINKLAEVPDPPTVSMMPQTAGWGILAAVLVLALGVFAYRCYLRWHAAAYRRAGLAELALVGEDVAQISSILKRVAFCAYPRADVAPLSGETWLAFLEGKSSEVFRQGPGAALAVGCYSKEKPAVDGLNDLACRWVRGHYTERAS